MDLFLNSKKFRNVILIIIACIITVIILFNFLKLDFGNMATLIVEIGIGIIIALFVHRSTKKVEKNNQITLAEIRKIVKADYEASSDVKKKIDEEILTELEKINGIIPMYLNRITDKETSNNHQLEKDIPVICKEFWHVKSKSDSIIKKIIHANEKIIHKDKQLILNQIIKKRNDIENGENILESTKELLIKAEYPKEEWQTKFNNFADKLNHEPIDLSSKIVKDEFEKILEDKSSSITLEDGTINEICEQFKNIEQKDRWEVTKQFVELLKPKISELDLEGLNKLEVFYSEVEDLLIPPIEILREMAKLYMKLDTKKYVALTLKAFGTRYWNWQGYMMENRVSWLVELYNFNNDSIGEILESFGKYNQEGYGPGGSIKRLGEFLQLTNQIEVLNETYSKMFDLCTTFFRTYEKTGLDYSWLKNKDFEKTNQNEILEKILESESKF